MPPETRSVPATVLSKWEKRGWFWNTFMVRFRLSPSGIIAEGTTSAENFYRITEGMTLNLIARRDEDGDWTIDGLSRV